MIKSLQTRIMLTTVIALTMVLLGAIFCLLYSVNSQTMNLMNSCLDAISIQDESLTFTGETTNIEGDVPRNLVNMSAIFAVHINDDDKVEQILSRNAEAMQTPVSDEKIKEYALLALEGQRRGWAGPFCYKVMEGANESKTVLLADSYLMRQVTNNQFEGAAIIIVIVYAVALIVMLTAIRIAIIHAERAYNVQKRFISNAEHEMKTPLSVISVDLDLLQRETGENPWIDDMRAETQSLTELTAKLVSISRLDEINGKLKLQPTNLTNLVEETLVDYEGICQEKGFTLITHIQPNRKANANTPELKGALVELMTNAIKYCDPKGTITISLFQEDNRVVFTIENTYQLVDTVNFEHLFERFFRTDEARRSQEGHGIGLSYARDVARAHKGLLTCYKGEDNSTIVFRLSL